MAILKEVGLLCKFETFKTSLKAEENLETTMNIAHSGIVQTYAFHKVANDFLMIFMEPWEMTFSEFMEEKEEISVREAVSFLIDIVAVATFLKETSLYFPF